MKIVRIEEIVKKGSFASSKEFRSIKHEIKKAIHAVIWPPHSKGFFLNPGSKGKGRGEGNGVKPIKDACITFPGLSQLSTHP